MTRLLRGIASIPLFVSLVTSSGLPAGAASAGPEPRPPEMEHALEILHQTSPATTSMRRCFIGRNTIR